jgi:hypothetical protein
MKIATTIVLLFSPIVHATKGFTYNDDVLCGAPFENFFIESITCGQSSFIHVVGDGAQATNVYEQDEICAFGDQMDIVGRVTISQAVARIYYVNLQACFRTGETSWYSAKKCMLFRASMDLASSTTEVVNEAETQAPNNIDYAEAGEYTFKSRVIIPKKTFVFKPGEFFYVTFLIKM